MFEVEEWQSISRQEDELVRSLFGELATQRSKKQKRKESRSHAGSAKGIKVYGTEKGEELGGRDRSSSGKKKKKRKTRAEGSLEGCDRSRKIKKLGNGSFDPELEMLKNNVQVHLGEEDSSEQSARLGSSERKRKKRKTSDKAVELKQNEHADTLIQTAQPDKSVDSKSVTKKTKKDKSKKAERKPRQEETGVENKGDVELSDTRVGTDFSAKKQGEETFEKLNIKEIEVGENKQVQAKLSMPKHELMSSSKSVLQEKMKRKLESSRFRWINEQLYTTKGCEAMDMFSDDPSLFSIYHRGFKAQVHQWPVNPVDVIIKWLRERPSSLVVADFGCGEATIAQRVPNKVHSFDLVAVNDQVTACDMSKVPLSDSSVDVAVFCLSLMGTNLVDYLQEAHRVLRTGGTLKIAEVVSRIEDTDAFVSSLSRLGFQTQETDTSNKMFIIFQFLKSGSTKQKSPKTGLKGLQLKPCIYKRR